MVYAAVAAGITAFCAVNAASIPVDLARHGIPALPTWQPLVWEFSSGVVILALVPAIHYGVRHSIERADRPLVLLPIHAALALAFSAAHVLGMVALRKLAYAAIGADAYLFDFSPANLLYEARKDVVVYFLIASIFGLAERRSGSGQDLKFEIAAPAVAPSELWLRDGATSVRIDPRDIAWVASAGNYVEYCLAGGERHLIRATLVAEEERLGPCGLVRVHRTRLVNVRRITRVTTRPAGGFEVALDTGEVIAGSRRYRQSVLDLGQGGAP
jgi:LytTr DNA-binding domain-containing protein